MAAVKIHASKNGRHAISTNAGSEEAFLAGLAQAVDGSGLPLIDVIPQIVDICCKLRGYKSNVTEHRVIIAGDLVPEDVVEAFSE